MPYTAPTVNYSATIDGTYTSLTGIQSVSVSRGRQRFQDNFTQTSCTIELIPAATYAVPFAIGQFIDVRDANSSSSPCYFNGKITDIQRNYAIPYNTSTAYAPQDRIVITATGPTGAFGTTSLSNYSLASSAVSASIESLATTLNIYLKTLPFGTALNIQNSPATNINSGSLDLLNALLRTMQYFIDDIDQIRFNFSGGGTAFFYPAGQGNTVFTFSDAGTSGAYKFTNLEYLSSVQNTFTQVQVTPTGLATQTANSGSAPYNTLVYSTYNKTTADAASLASYVLALQSGTTAVPFSITTNTNVASTCTTISKLTDAQIYVGGSDVMNLGSGVTVIFRGTSVNACIQGINTIFYPDYAQVQLYLSPSFGTGFTLNSSIFGVLDTNRLGYS